jgi:hypothetical protein
VGRIFGQRMYVGRAEVIEINSPFRRSSDICGSAFLYAQTTNSNPEKRRCGAACRLGRENWMVV